MDFKHIDRRHALGFLGVALPGSLLVRGVQAAPGEGVPAARAAMPPESASPAANFAAPAPVALQGLEARSYRVVEVGPIERGAFQLRLADASGDSFLVDVCAYDDAPSAPRGPARTSHLELFMVNSGHGSAPTHEGRGLAVMALATELQHHEHRVQVGQLLPLRDRQRLFHDTLYTLA